METKTHRTPWRPIAGDMSFDLAINDQAFTVTAHFGGRSETYSATGQLDAEGSARGEFVVVNTVGQETGRYNFKLSINQDGNYQIEAPSTFMGTNTHVRVSTFVAEE